MKHLIADLMRYHDPLWTAAVPLLALPLIAAGLWLLRRSADVPRRHRFAWLLACAVGMSLVTVTVLYAALRGSHPQIEVALSSAYLAGTILFSSASGFAAALLLAFAPRTARNTLLAGSLIASGFSCAVFVGMSGIVGSFTLFYDLTAVLAVMLVGSALVSFSLWENGHPNVRPIFSMRAFWEPRRWSCSPSGP